MSETIPEKIDTLIHARWLIPVQPRQTVLDHHSIAINKERIIAILPSTEARQRYQASEQQQLDQHVLIPGLINAHGHAAMTLFRGMADDKPLQSWLQHHIWPAEEQWVSEAFVRDGTEIAIAEMLRSGTTHFTDMYFFPNVVAQTAADAGIRAQVSFPIFDFPSAWGQDADDYIHKGLLVRDDFKHNPLIDVVFGPHATYTVADPAMKRIATLAAELDINIHIHLHETQQEVDEAIANSGKRPLQRLSELGLLTPRTQCVHMTAVNDDDIALLQQSGSHVVHCPDSNMKLASGFCPVQRLLDAGINVAIGTDGAASNNALNMLEETRSAALLAKVVAGDASAMPNWQALEMATLGGATALGLQHQLGSLEVGKQADIVAIDLTAIEQQPLYDIFSQLLYSHLSHAVTDSWIAGQHVLKNRQPSHLNLDELKQKARYWREKISG